MPPHAHGGDEEEVIVVRTDGPPFVDLKAKQGFGFELDYDKVSKYLGPGKLSLAEFQRDMDAINAVYVPTAMRSGFYLKYGSMGMLGAFAVLIAMGIVGGDATTRGVVLPLCMLLFGAGLLSFFFSKWVEQPAIKEGAGLVKALIDETINPRYLDSRFRVRWAVRVYMQPSSTLHMGKQFVERPIVSIYTLRSPNALGVLTDWVLPEAFTSGLFVDVTAEEKGLDDEDADLELDDEEGGDGEVRKRTASAHD